MRVLQTLLAVSLLADVVAARTITIIRVNLVDLSNGTIRPDTTVVLEGNRVT